MMKKGKDFVGVSCGAHILNEKNQILLMKRTKECRNYAGYWSVPGGGVEFFEKVEDAVKREVREELGVEIEIIKLLSVTNDIIEDEGQHWVATQFQCKIVSGTPTNLEPDKCDELKWFDLDKIPEKITLVTADGVEHLKREVL